MAEPAPGGQSECSALLLLRGGEGVTGRYDTAPELATHGSIDNSGALCAAMADDDSASSCCDGLRLGRVCGVAVALIAVLCILGVVAAVVVHLLRSDFTTHRQCVACLASGRVFNQSADGEAGTCLANVSAAAFVPSAANCPQCVASTEFCGAAECQYTESLPGLRSTPYWAMLVSAVFGVALSAAVNMVKMVVWTSLKSYACGGFVDEELQSLAGDKELRFIYLVANIVGAMDAYWFMLLYSLSIAHFIFIAVGVCNSPLHRTGWQQYEAIYLMWLNSGTVHVMAIGLAQFLCYAVMHRWWLDGWVRRADLEDRDTVAAARTVMRTIDSIALPMTRLEAGVGVAWLYAHGPLMLPLMPVLLTHVVPALVIFLPMFLPWLAAASLLFFALVRHKGSYATHARTVCTVLVTRVAGSLAVVIAVQTAANYAALLYGGMRWDRVVSHEWAARSTACYLNALVNGLQMYVSGLVGLLLS